MEKHILSLSTFIRGAQCLKLLYLNKKCPLLCYRLSDTQRVVFKRGTDVGVLAQQLFSDDIGLRHLFDEAPCSIYLLKGDYSPGLTFQSDFANYLKTTIKKFINKR